MSSIIPKELRTLAKLAEQQGWEITKTSGGHFRWRGPDGALVISGSTLSDHRAVKNMQARLRRGGLRI